MRRPLNWVVVCLSLLFLVANLSFDRKPGVPGPFARPVLAEGAYADDFRIDNAPIEKNDPQFGYVRADGSFLPLAKQDDAPVLAEAGAAVYVLSSPVTASKVPASF